MISRDQRGVLMSITVTHTGRKQEGREVSEGQGETDYSQEV